MTARTLATGDRGATRDGKQSYEVIRDDLDSPWPVVAIVTRADGRQVASQRYRDGRRAVGCEFPDDLVVPRETLP